MVNRKDNLLATVSFGNSGVLVDKVDPGQGKALVDRLRTALAAQLPTVSRERAMSFPVETSVADENNELHNLENFLRQSKRAEQDSAKRVLELNEKAPEQGLTRLSTRLQSALMNCHEISSQLSQSVYKDEEKQRTKFLIDETLNE